MNGNENIARAGLAQAHDANQQLSQITNSGEITGFVVLTQSEYDALPAGKLTDGKIYMVAGA